MSEIHICSNGSTGYYDGTIMGNDRWISIYGCGVMVENRGAVI